MRGTAFGLLLGAWVAMAGGCARPVKVAKPTEGVQYLVVRQSGMVPQARLLRCTEGQCEEVYEVDPAEGGSRP